MSGPMYEDVDTSGLANIAATALTWDYLKRIRDATRMKCVVKGILAAEDAKMAADNGYDAVIVSNHGGRNSDAIGSTIDALPDIIAAVNGRIPVLIDSGFRRGTDIVKALAMGAAGVAVGRPYLWGLGAFGEPGVERVLELLRTELSAAMGQVGAPNVKAIVPAMVKHV
jgi:4-hydroxymandelate oxidase